MPGENAGQNGAGQHERSLSGSLLVCGATEDRRFRVALQVSRPTTETHGLVVVTTRTSPERAWSALPAPSEQVRFVDARPREPTVGHVDGRVAVHDPSTGLDLRAVGEAILDASDALGANGASCPRVVVEDLDPILSHGSFERVYRLLHVLAAHVEEDEGALVVGVDPGEQDDRTQKVLDWLFDDRRTVER